MGVTQVAVHWTPETSVLCSIRATVVLLGFSTALASAGSDRPHLEPRQTTHSICSISPSVDIRKRSLTVNQQCMKHWWYTVSTSITSKIVCRRHPSTLRLNPPPLSNHSIVTKPFAEPIHPPVRPPFHQQSHRSIFYRHHLSN